MTNASTDLPICTTCGLQYAAPRDDCPICLDERQYVGWGGQSWTTLAELRRDHHGEVREEGPGILGVGTEPSFAIGQRALLVPAASGNVLWDCVTLFDDELAERIAGLGGISAIAISHPHYYSSMVEWARAFDVPVYVHAADREWIGRPDDRIRFWEGDTLDLADDLTLVNAGIHFTGGSVLHWPDADGGRGALLTGDILQVTMDRTHVSFMYSYPNLIPERPSTVRRAMRLLEPYSYDRIYGAWWGRVISSDAKGAVARSAERYLRYALDDDGS